MDEHLRSSQPHIFAIGDVNGGPQFTYISLDDNRIVADQLIGRGERSTADRKFVPYTVFMTPAFARVGLTEREARERGLSVKVVEKAIADIAAMPRAKIVGETRGLMKFVVDSETDLVLGAALLSVDSQETDQRRRARDAPRRHRGRAARRHLHAPVVHRGVQRGSDHTRLNFAGCSDG